MKKKEFVDLYGISYKIMKKCESLQHNTIQESILLNIAKLDIIWQHCFQPSANYFNISKHYKNLCIPFSFVYKRFWKFCHNKN